MNTCKFMGATIIEQQYHPLVKTVAQERKKMADNTAVVKAVEALKGLSDEDYSLVLDLTKRKAERKVGRPRGRKSLKRGLPPEEAAQA